DKLEVVDFYPYASLKTTIEKSENPKDGPALRFQISGQRVNVTEWLQQSGSRPGVFMLGPAQVILATEPQKPSGENEIVLIPKNNDELNYTVYSKRQKAITKKGVLKIGDIIQTGWMDINFRVLNLHMRATVKNEYKKAERPTPLTTSAVKVKLGENEYWVGQNSMVKASNADSVYLITYGNKRIDLGFNLTLKDFRIGRQEGTMRAATYESDVIVEGREGDIKISMNEPLVHNKYTFYQASFQEDPQGRPTASILSVNYDPGRWIKYLGSALIVLGSIIMFYFRKLLQKGAQ
ncbi:MAG: cytochrome c biogenesis protein ResB, partial [Bdellovibrionia bacterium]